MWLPHPTLRDLVTDNWNAPGLSFPPFLAFYYKVKEALSSPKSMEPGGLWAL